MEKGRETTFSKKDSPKMPQNSQVYTGEIWSSSNIKMTYKFKSGGIRISKIFGGTPIPPVTFHKIAPPRHVSGSASVRCSALFGCKNLASQKKSSPLHSEFFFQLSQVLAANQDGGAEKHHPTSDLMRKLIAIVCCFDKLNFGFSLLSP